MDWSVNSIQFLALKEVHGTFLECFLTTAANFAKKNDGESIFSNSQIQNLKKIDLLKKFWGTLKIGFR